MTNFLCDGKQINSKTFLKFNKFGSFGVFSTKHLCLSPKFQSMATFKSCCAVSSEKKNKTKNRANRGNTIISHFYTKIL